MNIKKDITIDFVPNFLSRWGYGRPPHKEIQSIFLGHLDGQRSFLEKCSPYMGFFEGITSNMVNEIDPYWNQTWLPPLDGISLYTVVADCKPKRYVEIGSGNSTKFAKLAIRQNKLPTEITSIDPYPRAEIDQISDYVFRKGVEDVDLSLFDTLSPNDVVFFDGSHRSFQNSDVTVFFLEILPRIPAGVTVGIHDIFLPHDYPPQWLERYYNEQYLLATHILAKKKDFKLIFSVHYMQNYHSNVVGEHFSNKLKTTLSETGKALSGGAIWFQT